MKEKLDELWPEGELRERISSEVIHCRRYVSLYPEDHPRVQGSLGTLKSLLEEHHRTTARPFFLQVSNVLETDEHPPQPTSAAELARLLETRLIEKLVIPPDVTAEALYKLCYLLREDALRQTRDQILIDLHRLPGISLSFYELHELATAAPEPPAEAPAAAPRSGVAVDDILAPLPEDARSALRNVLEDPSTAKRLESIGGLLAKESGAIDGASDERVSILREVLAAAAAPFESPDGAASAEEDVLARFETILRFL